MQCTLHHMRGNLIVAIHYPSKVTMRIEKIVNFTSQLLLEVRAHKCHVCFARHRNRTPYDTAFWRAFMHINTTAMLCNSSFSCWVAFHVQLHLNLLERCFRQSHLGGFGLHQRSVTPSAIHPASHPESRPPTHPPTISARTCALVCVCWTFQLSCRSCMLARHPITNYMVWPLLEVHFTYCLVVCGTPPWLSCVGIDRETVHMTGEMYSIGECGRKCGAECINLLCLLFIFESYVALILGARSSTSFPPPLSQLQEPSTTY